MTTAPAAPLPRPAGGTRPGRRGAWCRWLLLAGGAAACLGYLAIELRQLHGGLGWPLDDSWIHLQFARNLAAGRGLSYNPGELVTGSTAPLWTALLALLASLPGSALAWAQLAGGLLYLAGIDATWRLARELGLGSGLAALAGGLTLGTGWLVWSALSGMEIPLFVLLATWGMILHLRERAADGAAEAAGPAAATTAAPAAAAPPAIAESAAAPAAARPAAPALAPAPAQEDASAPPPSLPLAPAVLALAALARPEGLLLLALALLDRCLRFSRGHGAGGGAAEPAAAGVAADAAASAEAGARPAPLRWQRPPFGRLAAGGLLAACVLAGPLLFYRIAGGSFLPTTFGAKGGELRRWLPDLQYVYGILGILLRSQPCMTLLCCGGVAALAARLGTRRDRGLLPGLWMVALPLVYSTLSPGGPKMLAGNFGRYYFPLFPVVVMMGALALEGAAAALGSGVAAGRLRLPAGVVMAALMAWPTASDLLLRAGFYGRNLADVESSDVLAARLLGPRLPAGALLAVNDIGAFKYLLPNRIVDLAGIANPELRLEVERQMARGVPWDRAMAAAVARRRPDYVAIFPAWLPRLGVDLGLRPVLRLRIPGNITMGSDELVVYSTPWNRYPLRPPPGETGPGGAAPGGSDRTGPSPGSGAQLGGGAAGSGRYPGSRGGGPGGPGPGGDRHGSGDDGSGGFRGSAGSGASGRPGGSNRPGQPPPE
jgi:hypothetical protein